MVHLSFNFFYQETFCWKNVDMPHVSAFDCLSHGFGTSHFCMFHCYLYILHLSMLITKDLIRDSPTIFKIPVKIFNDQELTNQLNMLIRDTLTKAHSAIKQKVRAVINIYRLIIYLYFADTSINGGCWSMRNWKTTSRH